MTTRLWAASLWLLAIATSCRGGLIAGVGAYCDDQTPCRAHYLCTRNACALDDAGVDIDVDVDVDVKADGPREAPSRDGAEAPVEAAPRDHADAAAIDAQASCTPACSSEQVCCDDQCVFTSFDPRHCGDCATQCTGARATEACVSGKCLVAKCATGWADCNGDPTDGCEASLSDPRTCGSCGQSCVVANGSSVCDGGRCTPIVCDAGHTAANGSCESCAAPSVALCGRSSAGIVCASAQADGTLGIPTTFTTDFSDDATWTLLEHYSTIQFADVDGDGVADVCGRAAAGIFCGLGTNGTGFAPVTQWTSLFEDPYWAVDPSRYGSVRFPDIDGDGKADLCGQPANGMLCMHSDGSQFVSLEEWAPIFSEQATWALDESYWGTVQYPDINGDVDHKADVCGRLVDGLHCGLAGLSQFDNIELASQGGTFTDLGGWNDRSLADTIQFPDIDGDGRADACSRTPTGVTCQRASGFGTFAIGFDSPAFGDPTAGTSPPKEVWATIQFPDVDGDGKADLCGRLSTGLWCAISTGTSFGTLTLVSDAFSDANGFGDPLYSGSIQFADLDGDGAADVCGRRSEGVVCALSNRGGSFKPSTRLAAFADADGWSQPASASTLMFVTLKRDIRQGCSVPPHNSFLRAAARLLR